jgi:hypothetical protein
MHQIHFPGSSQPSPRPAGLLGIFLAALLLGGCYTQLYTGSYLERSQAYAGERDTLAPEDTLPRTSPTIVNNYYAYDGSSYRGYAYQDWEYPILSFGFYSSRYRNYHDPYWWDRSWHRRHYPHSHYRHHGRSHIPGTGHNSGPYKSDKRIFSTPSDIPRPEKGRRSDPPPKSSGSESPPAAKSSDSGDKEAEKPAQDKQEAYPSLQKGRRR